MLRYVEVQGGENINELMLREGYARVSPIQWTTKITQNCTRSTKKQNLGYGHKNRKISA